MGVLSSGVKISGGDVKIMLECRIHGAPLLPILPLTTARRTHVCVLCLVRSLEPYAFRIEHTHLHTLDQYTHG